MRADGDVELTDEQLWNGTLHGIFDRVVAENGRRVAVRDGGGSWNYEELDARSEAWGRELMRRGEQPLGGVVLMMPKGRELLAAMLGVLKAGGYFLCVDAATPAVRREAMARQAGARILCVAGDEGVWPDFHGARISAREIVDGGGEVCDFPQRGGGDRCFVIQTSGTTGEPRGIMVTHRSWLHTVARHGRFLGLVAGDNFTWLASPWSSAGLSAPFAALLHGAATHPFDVREQGLHALAGWLGEREITVMHSTPTLFRSLAAQVGKSGTLHGLRVLRLGGEPACTADFELFRRHFRPGAIFLNGYGSSEAGYVSCHRMEHGDRPAHGQLPVGLAAAGHEIVIMDGDGREVEQGGMGEIVVRSRWLPEGCCGGAERESGVFRQVAGDPEMREYWSGDVGFLTPEGRLRHCGRKDDQVKVRGLRVDLGAVAEAIRQLHGVEEAAVLLNEAGSLTAFVVTTRRTEALRGELGQVLPDWMLPSRWRRLDRLPLKANGKLDRGALRALPPEPVCLVPARTAHEHALLALWREVLGQEEVGVYDDFFALGGTSLDSLTLLARIKQVLKRTVTPVLLMERPTVAQLAEVLDKGLAQQSGERLAALRTGGHGPPVFLFPGGWGGENELLVFAAMLPFFPEHLPVYGVLHQWMSTGGAEETTLADMVQRISTQIREITKGGACHLVGECIASALSLEVACLPGSGVSTLVLLDPTEVDVSRESEASLPAAVRAYRLALKSAVLRAPGCPVYLIGCRDEAGVDERLAAWREKTGAVSLARVPGDHDSYIREHGPVTARELAGVLTAAGSPNAKHPALPLCLQASGGNPSFAPPAAWQRDGAGSEEP